MDNTKPHTSESVPQKPSVTTENDIIEDTSRSSENMVELIVGLAGGSGSGKTTIAQMVLNQLDSKYVSLISHDCYYKDLGDKSIEERRAVNFDHPNSLDTELLVTHLKKLRRGRSIRLPTYDFSSHTRVVGAEEKISPTRIVIVEGILLFQDPELRDLLDVKIYVDTDPDLRFIRRLTRDIAERGRTVEDVTMQYLGTVRPMHMDFVEPTKRFADVIIPEGGRDSHIATGLILSRIHQCLNKQ